MSNPIIHHLLQKGVKIPQPDSVYIGTDVVVDLIAPDAVIMPGCRIDGSATVIGSGSVIGAEGPAVVSNCQIGRKVTLGSGFFDTSVFLDGSSMGSGAHVRPGCLLEEQAGGAHTVGLKQTILMPYVTLGSLINFCDCLMAGGTSRKNHSEVGSSYIHFNFTPHQDKATPSLIGDVPRGVLLNQSPIFLGGQGGLVGPARIAFGSVIPAGQVIRHDILEPGQLVIQAAPPSGSRGYDQTIYGSVSRMVKNNLIYIGNVKAMKIWYRQIRAVFMDRDPVSAACRIGALRVLDLILNERIKRLAELTEKLPESIRHLESRHDAKSREHLRQQTEWVAGWPKIRPGLESDAGDSQSAMPDLVARVLPAAGQQQVDYFAWLKSLDKDTRVVLVAWLEHVVAGALKHLNIKDG